MDGAIAMKGEAGGLLAYIPAPGGAAWGRMGTGRGTVGACTRRVRKQAGLVSLSLFSFFLFFSPVFNPACPVASTRVSYESMDLSGSCV